jgi:hypothetical protein
LGPASDGNDPNGQYHDQTASQPMIHHCIGSLPDRREDGHHAFSGRLEKSIIALRPVQTYIDNPAPGSEVELLW